MNNLFGRAGGAVLLFMLFRDGSYPEIQYMLFFAYIIFTSVRYGVLLLNNWRSYYIVGTHSYQYVGSVVFVAAVTAAGGLLVLCCNIIFKSAAILSESGFDAYYIVGESKLDTANHFRNLLGGVSAIYGFGLLVTYEACFLLILCKQLRRGIRRLVVLRATVPERQPNTPDML